MTLINDGASFPSYMWAVVRLLLALGGKADAEIAKLLLTPPTLPAGETDEFSVAVKSLSDLGIVAEGPEITLTPTAQQLSSDDVAGFKALLRRGALDPARNVGLEESPEKKPDLEGPKDLVRALAWFLTRPPLLTHDWEMVAQPQRDAFASGQARPFTNDTRWNRFGYWAPALGFAAVPLIPAAGKSPLLPDCTVAVRETIQGLWKNGDTIPAGEAVARIIEELPVLPGGKYSRQLGLPVSEDQVSPVLSYALLTGEGEGWLVFSNPSDAGTIFLSDGSGSQKVEVESFTIKERV